MWGALTTTTLSMSSHCRPHTTRLNLCIEKHGDDLRNVCLHLLHATVLDILHSCVRGDVRVRR
jgi:hypothetical protein